MGLLVTMHVAQPVNAERLVIDRCRYIWDIQHHYRHMHTEWRPEFADTL